MQKKIFIVEDDFVIQMFFETLILREGHEVVATVSSSEEALLEMQRRNIDLILMDIGIMGEKTGIEIAKINNDNYKIPLVFVTGNSDKFTIEAASKTKPIGFIFKPIDEDSFCKQLREIFKVIEVKK